MKVLSYKNFPARLPITRFLCLWLLLDRYRPAQWVWTLAIVWASLLTLGFLYNFFREETVDIFKEPASS